MRKAFLKFTLISALLAVSLAAASGLILTGGTVSSGAESDLVCDEDGVRLTFTLSGSDVTHATVSDISADCKGVTLFLLFDVAPAGPGSEDQKTFVVPLNSSSFQFTFSPSIASGDLISSRITLVGQDQESPNAGD
jgi:exosome complex RNA-binding protein Csl4